MLNGFLEQDIGTMASKFESGASSPTPLPEWETTFAHTALHKRGSFSMLFILSLANACREMVIKTQKKKKIALSLLWFHVALLRALSVQTRGQRVENIFK